MFYSTWMDWDFAIERHRESLLLIVAALFAKIGLAENGGVVERLSRPVYRQVLGVLRRAESAVRRLIFVAARNIVVEPREPRLAREQSKISGMGKVKDKPKSKRGPLFKLFDPPKRFKKFYGRPALRRGVEPRVRIIDYDPRIPEFLRSQFLAPAPVPAAPVLVEEDDVDDDTVNAGPLIRRLLAIKSALEDIPRQAERLAHWRARPVEERRPQRSSPLRIGRPPGFRQRAKHEVDEILKECHWLARNVEPQLDTS
jgi:hypothetical protein